MKATEDQFYSMPLRGHKQVGAVEVHRIRPRVGRTVEDLGRAIGVKSDVPCGLITVCARC